MDTSLVASLRKKLEAQKVIEAPKPVATAATPTAGVEARAAFSHDTQEAFAALAEAGEKLRGLTSTPEHKRGDGVQAQIVELTAGIAAVKADIRSDGAAYQRYIGEVVPKGPEAMEVLEDFADRGILGKINAAEAQKMEEGWAEWRAKRDAGASEQELEEFRRERNLQKVFTMPERRDRSPVHQHFVKKYPVPEGTEGLMKALASRFRYWEEGDQQTEWRASRLAGKFGVDGTKTLANIANGEVGPVGVWVTDAAWWVDKRSGALQSLSALFINGLGVNDKGVAMMEILGAAGPIYFSMRHHMAHEEKDGRKVPATVFGFVPRRGFDGGLCRLEVDPNGAKKWSEKEERWLLALLRAIGGFPRTSPAQNLRQFKPQTPRGQTNLPEGETRKHNSRPDRRRRGGGKRHGADDFGDDNE